MKKQLVFLLAALALCVGLCACGSGPKTAVRLEAPASAAAENGGVALCHYRTGGDLHAITFTRYIRGNDGWELTDWNPAVFDEGDLVSNEGDISWKDDKLWLCGAGFSLPDPEDGTAAVFTQVGAAQEQTFDANFDVTVPLLTRRVGAGGTAALYCTIGENAPDPDPDAAFEELICVTFHDTVPEKFLSIINSDLDDTIRLETPENAENEEDDDETLLCTYRTTGELHAVTFARYISSGGGWTKTDWTPGMFDEDDLIGRDGQIRWRTGEADELVFSFYATQGAWPVPEPEDSTARAQTRVEQPAAQIVDTSFGKEVPLCIRTTGADGEAAVRCILGEEQPVPSADAAFEELICVTFHDAVPASARQPDSMTLTSAEPDEFESQALQDNGIHPDGAAFFRAAVDDSIRSAVLRRYVMRNGGWKLDDSQVFPVSGGCTVAVGGVDNNREFLTWCASGSDVHLKTWANADASLMAHRTEPAGITAGTELALVCRTSEDMHFTEDTFSSLDNIKAALSQSTDNEIVTIEFSTLPAQ